MFAAGAGKKAGEFYTPQEVSQILYVKVTKLNSMKQHVHSGKVECRRVLLLTINQISFTIASSTEKQ